MYLKKIELFGFKSFADKTEISFERGVTCVVGPNGCGKSNISDSIRWVLGERSAKLLRGTKMEDVIFAGTDFRKSVNFAEVSLTIDNSDQKLAIQYEEVVITRRLHRSGESEYLINKTPCRLKDIQDLILDTGIGSNSYSMIEQGRIDYILNAEAEERRSLIEEAAGISKYKVKKEEALRKLERTEENLLRLNDIVSEVERNIRYAERQAQRAEKYKDQFEQLKKLEIQKAFFELRCLDEQLNLLEQERNERTLSFNGLEEEVSKQTVSTRGLEDQLRELEQKYMEYENNRSEVKQELLSLENYEKFHREKIEFLKLNGEKALGEIESLNQRREHLDVELKRKAEEGKQLLVIINQLQSEKKQRESLLTGLPEEKHTEGDELTEQQTRLFDLARQISDLKNTLNKNQVELLTLERTQATLRETKAKLTQAQNSLVNRQSTIAAERSSYEKKLVEARNASAEFSQRKQSVEISLEATRTEIENVRAQKTKLENQLHLLEELDHANGPDPKKIVAEHGSHPSLQGMTKALLDLVEIEPGYELATEAALAESLRAVVAENTETAVHLLNQLKKAGSHRATIFIKDRAILNGSLAKDLEAEAHPLIKKRLWDVIHVQKGYDGVFGNLLGKIYIIDEITSESVSQLAHLAQRIKLVSKSGAIFGPEFQITLRNGGYTPERSAFARKKEIERLKNEIIKSASKEGSLAGTLAEKEQKDIGFESEEKRLNQHLLERQTTLERLNGTTSGLLEHLKRVQEELVLTEEEEREGRAETGRLQIEEQEWTYKLNALEAQQAQTENRLDVLQKKMHSATSEKEIIERELEQLVSKLDVQAEKKKDVEQAVSFLEGQTNDILSRMTLLASEREEAFLKIKRLGEEREAFGNKKGQVAEALIQRTVAVEQVKQKRNELILERNQAIEKTQEVVKALEQVKQKFNEYNLKQMELNHQKNSIRQELASRYKVNLSELNSSDYVLAQERLEEVRLEIERLREKLDSIGTVNLLAIEEYQELKSRYDFLLNQKQDLTEARDSLMEAIRKINRTTKKLFEDTLIHVREAFREYFRILFKGGQADLILLDEVNPIESGLDIVARPPGKKLQHISLLSGGEKALTAIALLLALFSVKPSPFCVLDEVDAPLDEPNNERFLNALKPFLNSTQFIIVTHSRKTIAMGDALYGVTMQEPGISKIVSVRLSSEHSGIEHTDQKLASELNQVLN